MPTEAEYVLQIRDHSLSALLELWDSIRLGQDLDGWADGRALEYLVLRAFELEGAGVEYPFRVELDKEEIEQIDGVVYADGMSCLIETKDTATAVNVEPIAKLRHQLLRRPTGTIGVVFSRSGFTTPAKTHARFMAPQTILTWDGAEIDFALRRNHMIQGLVAKYRYCVRFGLPDLILSDATLS